ncbi:aspartate 1-decarboxylase [Omnitrophica bacterium]|nr:aspartate 1-decarboxylase [Candidatus Omnitrophota bacterium]
MQRQLLNGKIHGATVTEARVDYQGSITIDSNLLKATDMVEGEKVLIANLNNGARLESYIMVGEAGSGVICLNGGAAKHGQPGDKVIIMSFAVLEPAEVKGHKPKVVHVDAKNRIV